MLSNGRFPGTGVNGSQLGANGLRAAAGFMSSGFFDLVRQQTDVCDGPAAAFGDGSSPPTALNFGDLLLAMCLRERQRRGPISDRGNAPGTQVNQAR